MLYFDVPLVLNEHHFLVFGSIIIKMMLMINCCMKKLSHFFLTMTPLTFVLHNCFLDTVNAFRN